MKKILNNLILLGIASLFFACSAEDDLIVEWQDSSQDPGVAPPPSGDAGSLDLSKYVSVGNSLTAGIADGALFPAGQASSYPSILATQFAAAGGGEFNNPNIISGATGTGRISLDLAIALAFLETGEGSLADALITGAANPLTANTVSVNNFGVPGARSIDLVFPGYGTLNPFFGAFQSGATATVVGDAAAANGSIFSLWIGGNDVLGYATNGGTNDVYNPLDPSTITSVGDFSAAVSGALDALSAGGAEGVLLTVPQVATSPFFQAATTLGGGVELVPLADAAQVDQLNGAFNVPFPSPIEGVDPGYNSLLDVAVALDPMNEALAAEVARRKITWQLGANAPLITDESLSVLDISAAAGLPAGSIVLPQLRQAAAANPLAGLGDLFPLPALFSLGQVLSPTAIVGVTVPLADSLTLTETEQVNVITAVATFNGVLALEAAARPNVTLVDLDPLIADLNGLSAAQATGLGMSAAGIAAADGTVGRVVNGANLVPISFETTELYNSVFSTDFIHLNSRGYALIANEIIGVLNSTYNATIPTVNPLEFAPINAPL